MSPRGRHAGRINYRCNWATSGSYSGNHIFTHINFRGALTRGEGGSLVCWTTSAGQWYVLSLPRTLWYISFLPLAHWYFLLSQDRGSGSPEPLPLSLNISCAPHTPLVLQYTMCPPILPSSSTTPLLHTYNFISSHNGFSFCNLQFSSKDFFNNFFINSVWNS